MNPFLSVYCERAGEAGLLAEPLNAVSNVAFLLAACLIWRRLAGEPGLSLRRHADIAALAGVVFMIGLGSAAWHIWPTRATLLSDVIPITVFIHGFIAVFFHRVFGLAWPWAIGIVLVFAALSFGAPSLLSPRALGSTAAYLPAYLALLVTTAGLFIAGNPRRHGMLRATLVWTPSLILRSLDGAGCAYFPLGTHFVWHILNATVLYLLLAVLIAAALDRPRDTQAGAG
jgi:hypothetical protein